MVSADILFWFERKEKKWLIFFVTGDVKLTWPTTVEDSIKKILLWILFTTEEHRNSIFDDSIEPFIEIRMFIDTDILDLSTEFSIKTQDIGKIHFDMHRTKWVRELLNWVQYFYRISGDTYIVEMNTYIFIK